MPSIDENRQLWSELSWRRGGEIWSLPWGGSPYEWWGTLFPRIQAFLPTGTLLELGPGFGRWTRYLVQLSDRLIGVDLVEKCVEHCRERFAEHPHASFHQNDGMSLEIVPDATVDFAFSFDSLVHVERDVIEAYLSQLARKLTPEAIGFIHHSNLGRYVDPASGELPFENVTWRGLSVSASVFEELCARAGLACVGQEQVNWLTDALSDCFSLITLPESRFARPNVVIENARFMDEAAALRAVAEHYGSNGFPGVPPARPPEVEHATAPERRAIGDHRR